MQYREIVKPIDAVQFGKLHYAEDPFDVGEVPEWLQKLVDSGKIVPIWTKDVPHWRYDLYHDEQKWTIEPTYWLIYRKDFRSSHLTEYQIMSDDGFRAQYETA